VLIPDLLARAISDHPDREAYVHGDKRATYAWLGRSAGGFAATLLDLGVERGDVVVLALGSSIKFAACYLGALQVGAITSAINLRLGRTEQRSIFERTEPRVTVLGDGAELPAGANPGTVISVTDLGPIFRADNPDPARLPRLSPTDPTCIVWTSGTTGEPKGAVYDHAGQIAISRNIGELTAPGDRRLSVLPFAHVGYMTRMADELDNATTIVMPGEPWTPAEHLRLVREEAITMVTGVPTQWQRVLDHPDLARTDFSGVRVAGLGGASIAPELVRRMRDTLGCPVLARYTSTHIGDPDEVVANTVGRPTPEVEVRLVVDGRTGDQGHDVAPGEVGEVTCRSPAMMREYWKDPERTAEVIDADGFLHTGDLGSFDADGNLRIVGRLKDMYIRGGYNVYPAEVEGVLSEHPSVARSAVVGIADTERDLGEIGVAFIVAADEGVAPDLGELKAWCRAQLADYKAPDRLVVVDDLPVTAMMKVDKRALLARLEEDA